jgi:hypothetical protein
MNNPLRYIDPTGHDPVCAEYDDDGTTCLLWQGGNPESDPAVTTTTTTTTTTQQEICKQCHTTQNRYEYYQSSTYQYQPGSYSYYDPTQDIDSWAKFILFGKELIGVGMDLKTGGTLLKKGFMLGKALTPNPLGEAIIGAGIQAISDLNNPSLTIGQRIARAGVVGVESAATDVVSDLGGAAGFVIGEAIVPTGGGIVGYAGGSLVVSLAMDEMWNQVNQQYFESNGLGEYP